MKLNLREQILLEHALASQENPVKRKKSAVIIKTERKKETLPFYSTQEQKIIELPFATMT